METNKKELQPGLNLNGWDMHDINVAIRDKSLFEIMEMYINKGNEMTFKAVEYMQAVRDGSDIAKKRLEKEIEHLDKEKCVIAIRIADTLTKSNLI